MYGIWSQFHDQKRLFFGKLGHFMEKLLPNSLAFGNVAFEKCKIDTWSLSLSLGKRLNPITWF